MSPSAKTSGWPGSVRSGSTVTRPARSCSAPVRSASAEASPDAVHAGGPDDGARRDAPRRAVRVLDRDAGLVDADDGAAEHRRHAEPAQRALGLRRQRRRERRSARGRRPRRAGCGRWRDRWCGSRGAGCRGRARRSGRPSRRRSGRRRPPTNVSHSRRRSGSRSSSAASKAARMRPRTVSALSSDFTSARVGAPLVVAEVGVVRAAGDDQRVVGHRLGRRQSGDRPQDAPRAARGRSRATSASTTRTLRLRLKIARSG